MKTALKVCSLLLAMLIASLPVTFAVELRLTYDANGNLLTGDGKYRVYNSLNQLAAVYNGTNATGTLLETYVYHPTEERILVKRAYNADGSLRETTYYLSKTFVRIVNLSGTYDETFVYADGQLISQNINGTKTFFATDHKGNVMAVMNSSGSVIENTSYTPFGGIVSGGNQSKLSYEGKEQDSLVGDTDYHFRKYRQDLGIFSQPDNLIQNVYTPQTLNHYSFEGNNPLKNIDPTGHIFAIDIGFFPAALGQDTISIDPSAPSDEVPWGEGQLPDMLRNQGYQDPEDLPEGGWLRNLIEKFPNGGLGRPGSDGSADVARFDTPHSGMDDNHINVARYVLDDNGIPKPTSNLHLPYYVFPVMAESTDKAKSVTPKSGRNVDDSGDAATLRKLKPIGTLSDGELMYPGQYACYNPPSQTTSSGQASTSSGDSSDWVNYDSDNTGGGSYVWLI